MEIQLGLEVLEVSDTKFPVVVFSHGLCGTRTMYSIICSELASHGYVVFALEHADGSASAAKIAGKRYSYKFYQGLGGEKGQVEKTEYRIKEMKSIHQIIRALHKGNPPEGLILSEKKNPSNFLKGKLDLRCIAAVGHSYGGATVAGLCAEDPLYRCGVCLDPWWPALPQNSAALSGWQTKAPLLVVGSHDWNTPTRDGTLICDGIRQELILDACRIRQKEDERNGSGAIHLVITGSSHNTFADPLPLFSEKVNFMFDFLGLSARLDPVLGVHLVNLSILNFLSMHLPLSSNQRQLQTWSPSSNAHSALGYVRKLQNRTGSSATNEGFFWWMHKGKGLLSSVSDKILDHILQRENGGSPDDIVTTDEVLESFMPTEEHGNAPNSIRGIHRNGEMSSPLDATQRQSIRSHLGRLYAETVQESHVDHYIVLLGQTNVHSCKAYVR